MKKAVIWGHKLHSHTHSYVHEGFFRAFRHLGFECHWLDNQDDISGLDLADALFLTEGQVDGKIPMRQDCKYVLHNCDMGRYESVRGNVLRLQAYTDEARQGSERIDDWTWYRDGCLHQPWATDLLPHEIDLEAIELPRERKSFWVGTIGAGRFGNVEEIEPFREACEEHGVEFVQRSGVDREEHIALCRRSWLAPAILGSWQLRKGYIPCRIFKNVSYGQPGLTNSPTVDAVFGGQLVRDADTRSLFFRGDELIRDGRYRAAVRAQMALVRDRHTYVHRIGAILEALP